ncbi:MAG: Flp family type IVb pilin [Planctomycetota bacterium]
MAYGQTHDAVTAASEVPGAIVRGQTAARAFVARFLCDETAATAVEYAVMLAMILLAMLGTIGTVGAQSGGMWGGIEDNLRAVGFMGPTGS